MSTASSTYNVLSITMLTMCSTFLVAWLAVVLAEVFKRYRMFVVKTRAARDSDSTGPSVMRSKSDSSPRPMVAWISKVDATADTASTDSRQHDSDSEARPVAEVTDRRHAGHRRPQVAASQELPSHVEADSSWITMTNPLQSSTNESSTPLSRGSGQRSVRVLKARQAR